MGHFHPLHSLNRHRRRSSTKCVPDRRCEATTTGRIPFRTRLCTVTIELILLPPTVRPKHPCYHRRYRTATSFRFHFRVLACSEETCYTPDRRALISASPRSTRRKGPQENGISQASSGFGRLRYTASFFNRYASMNAAFYARVILSRWYEWRLRCRPNVELQGRLIVRGRPIIHLHRQARLELGNGVCLRSDPVNYHGPLYGPVKLQANRPGAEIIVGEGTRLNACTLAAWKRIAIGRRCLVAANTAFLDAHGHSTEDIDCFRRSTTKDSPEPVEIEDHVWIGLNCLICKGVRIGRGSIVGAGSVVTRSVPAFTVVAGVPARPLRSITPPEHSDIEPA